MLNSNTVLCLMGPTASGKTDLAINLSQQVPISIISVDSAMVYQGMDIGSAKPDRDTLAKAPHQLVDILPPNQTYSAARFCQDATVAIEQSFKRGNIPLLVGGTMMYFKALQQGLSSLPQADEAIRQQLLQQAEQVGWATLHQQLSEVDPASAKKINANDSQRIQRALEVWQITGKPLSSFADSQTPSPYRFINLALFPQKRDFLHHQIARRFEVMLKMGFIEEVENLIKQYQLTLDTTSMKAVGYRQALHYLNGDYDRETFKQKAISATRQLAKRQLTWLRTWPQVHYFEPWQINLPIQLHDTLSKIELGIPFAE